LNSKVKNELRKYLLFGKLALQQHLSQDMQQMEKLNKQPLFTYAHRYPTFRVIEDQERIKDDLKINKSSLNSHERQKIDHINLKESTSDFSDCDELTISRVLVYYLKLNFKLEIKATVVLNMAISIVCCIRLFKVQTKINYLNAFVSIILFLT
jgi:hypothetical protein